MNDERRDLDVVKLRIQYLKGVEDMKKSTCECLAMYQ